ncbi:MAG: DUF1622 domain-containing protein [Chloroflexi bacterium]|nr:DUF1622 domain-containing protein [Chloroflexota bacterium]
MGIGVIAVLIILYGVVIGVGEFVLAEWRRMRTRAREAEPVSFEKIRYDIGFHLILGLEFLIAADIIRSVLNPTLPELAVLGGIVAIRTVLSYFLEREINRTGQRQ